MASASSPAVETAGAGWGRGAEALTLALDWAGERGNRDLWEIVVQDVGNGGMRLGFFVVVMGNDDGDGMGEVRYRT